VDDPGVNNTWVCHAPESCGCEWSSTTDMLILQPRQCKDMGSDARVALYAPSQLAPYVSLPTSIGGSTGYFSTTKVNGTSTWITTVIPGCQCSPSSNVFECLGNIPLIISFRHPYQYHRAHNIWPSANTSRTHQWRRQTLCIDERRSSGHYRNCDVDE
jgi:hypothetical protein